MAKLKYTINGKSIRSLLNEEAYGVFLWNIKKRGMNVEDAYNAACDYKPRIVYRVNGVPVSKLLKDGKQRQYFYNLMFQKKHTFEEAYLEALNNFNSSDRKSGTRMITRRTSQNKSDPIDIKIPNTEVVQKSVDDKKVKNKLYVENFTFTFKRSTLIDKNLNASFTKELVNRIYEVIKTTLINNDSQVQDISYPVLEKYEISEKE